jgi:mevalonate kinase
MLKESLYYAKILLFGEYGIIEDSMGLSIPYTFFKGKFELATQPTDVQLASNQSIAKFVYHLQEMSLKNELPCEFNFGKLNQDIQNGLYFDSSIPQGFGVGSSGARVAALYNQYSTDQVAADEVMKGDNLANLKLILSKLESYFHGKSSGLDPLICYLNLPILIKGKGDLGAVGMPSENVSGKGAIFLMDSGSPGKTQGMVAIFLQKLKDEGFRNLVRTQLKKYNDGAVKSFLKGENKPLFENVKAISSLFLDNFKPMIPQKFEGVWRKGLETNAYYLKLCGSGGGGFVLGFTQDFEKAEKMLEGHKLQVIYKI